MHRVGPTQYLVRVGRSIRYVHVDHILKSGEAPEDVLSPDSQEGVMCDTPALPPHVPPGIPHVPQTAGLMSEMPASPRPTPDIRVHGLSVHSPTSTPMRDVQQRAPTTGVQQRAPTTGVQQKAPTNGVQTGTPEKRCSTQISYAIETLSSVVQRFTYKF